MYKQYLGRLTLPNETIEYEFLKNLRQSYYDGVYPFKLFPGKGLDELVLSPLTIFYGGNGSGKSTLLNIIAEIAGVQRHAPFNGSPFFSSYVEECQLEGFAPRQSQILTSDDVFDYLLNLRCLNEGISSRRAALFEEYTQRRNAPCQLRSMDDYDDFKESLDAKRQSLNGFVRQRLRKSVKLQSNGESALDYFVNHITEDAVYLLDEPENSMSIALQEELSQFLSESARHFGCQLIIATHSPILLAMEDAVIYDLDEYPVRQKAWTELENVRKYFDFFMQHKQEFA